MESRTRRVSFGLVAANGTGLALILLAWWLMRLVTPQGGEGWFILSEFILIPLAMGFVAALFWATLDPSKGECVGWSALTLGAAILVSTIVLREGIICILMALPLVVPFFGIGVGIGMGWFGAATTGGRVNASIIPILIALIVTDAVTARGFYSSVTDTIVIKASPETVWQYIVDYPAISESPDFWLWRIGLPAPIQSTSTAREVGATRRCVFTGGIAFDERITEMEPAKHLAFDITSQPKHPEIIGHFVLKKGEFILRGNADGTTTVIGTSWYTLNVHPAIYYDLWTQCIVRNVHMRVMRHIKALAESPVKSL